MLFGYDTASFGGILANAGFIDQFGTLDPTTGEWAFASNDTSLLSSIPFVGKFLGCLLAGPAIERFGHRMVFFGLSVISILGIIIEITAADSANGSGRFAQFIVGRVIVYISVGLVEVDVTTYQAEIVPAPFRGLVVVSLQLFLNAGTILATGVNKAFSDYTTAVGWKVVTAIQFIFPLLMIAFTLFIPSSPRWLLSKDRTEDAVASLSRLRSQHEVDSGHCEIEIAAIREALQEHVHKASWWSLVRGTNLRRTALTLVYYFFQQTTGQAFVSTYQTTFYRENGYASNAFLYPVINSVLSFLSVVPAMYMVDRLGRRWTLLISYSLQAFWMYLLAGLGERANKTGTQSNTIVAAFMLFAFSYNMGSASIPYLLGSEIPNSAVREKTQAIGTSWNVVWAFVTNYSIPFMIDNIHFKVGWVFGSISIVAFAFTFMFLPETKGRALEEIDAIFKVKFNPFRSSEVQYAEAEYRVGVLEGEKEKEDLKPESTWNERSTTDVSHV
ncbi:uncharacterized protein LTR77_010291 [Saxophila tyrrhenica]|uniref:Major facilitator superfamily (MFS) profile domain-containing protein n=1 Tax=Saxophila tyrrhenica TaxID=1690608 RepID=A0AAV9NZL9_9PEZI|nr:hypothetical protein LTR77_010291 [Saxophila tyrrhenica]